MNNPMRCDRSALQLLNRRATLPEEAAQQASLLHPIRRIEPVLKGISGSPWEHRSPEHRRASDTAAGRARGERGTVYLTAFWRRTAEPRRDRPAGYRASTRHDGGRHFR